MSLRTLPKFELPAISGAQFDIPPRALSSWDLQVKAASNAATISILDYIGDDGMGGGVTVARVAAALRAIGDNPVTVQINSPGGNYFDGLAMYNLLGKHPKPVLVQVIGLAASAASIIAMAGDRIEVAKAAMLMIHNTQWIAIGDRHVMSEVAGVMAQFDAVAAGVYADRAGLDPKDAGKLMDAETYLSGQDAVDQGFADALMAAEPTKGGGAKQSIVARVEAALARAGTPRQDRRALIKDLIGAMPSAEPEQDAPSAVQDEDGGRELAELLAGFKIT